MSKKASESKNDSDKRLVTAYWAETSTSYALPITPAMTVQQAISLVSLSVVKKVQREYACEDLPTPVGVQAICHPAVDTRIGSLPRRRKRLLPSSWYYHLTRCHY
ncbi:hypothetical protein AcW1_005246 [Taiwanofungus camphoratus]|nr:hypothetical protein AcW2_004016 [Antrodia cinnamomea]KAI0956608.1 hypothetical protein AcW1_005246 [Antrodia cinnamomea]